jgi:hypothetical protein
VRIDTHSSRTDTDSATHHSGSLLYHKITPSKTFSIISVSEQSVLLSILFTVLEPQRKYCQRTDRREKKGCRLRHDAYIVGQCPHQHQPEGCSVKYPGS